METKKSNDLSAVRGELDTLTRIIAETVPVEQIYLFGSYAYGTPHQDSDFDLYVVLKDDAPIRELDAMTNIHLALYGVQKRPTDVLARKVKAFQARINSLGIEQTVATEGIKIYG